MTSPLSPNPKTALVFGGSRGIGAAIARRLAADGFSVALTYASSPDKAGTVVAAIQEQGGKAFAIEADSNDPAAIRTAVATATERLGKLHTVVVNAGVLRLARLDALSLEDLDAMLDVNIRGVFLAIQAAGPHIAENGRVITIGSNTAVRNNLAESTIYAMTKAAVASMVQGLALDFASRRITVNNVQPGPTATDMTAGFESYLLERSPLKRIAQPEEIAGLVAFLASDASAYMTGASLTIDGGFIL